MPVPTVVDRTDVGEDADAARANRRRALRLAALPGTVLGAVVLVVVSAVGLPVVGVPVGLVLAVAVTALVWSSAPGVVLASLGARPSREADRPRLHNLVEGLCATMGLPRPELYVVPSLQPNAVAVGRDPATAALVVTDGLERSLSLVELEGVLAHELVHVKRHETTVAGVAVRLASWYARLAGTDAGVALVHRLVGPGREYAADQRAASVVRYPAGIGGALEVMAAGADGGARPWPPSGTGALSRWLWIDPLTGAADESAEGNLDDTRVRAAALALR